MNLKKGILLIATSAFVFGCDSKNVEKSPDRVTVGGFTLEEKLAEKIFVDNAIEKIENGSKKIKRIVNLARKAKNKDFDENGNYTPVDFLIDLNADLKNKMPETDDGSLVRRGKLVLPLKNLSEDCKTIETLLAAKPILADDIAAEEDKKIIGQTLTYSFKSCGQDKFLEVATVTVVVNQMSFSLHKTNLNVLLQDILKRELAKETSCKFDFDDTKIISSIQCTDLDIKLSSTEVATFSTLNYDTYGDVRLEGYAEIFENDMLKAKASILIEKGGKAQFDVKKITAQ